MIYFFIGSGIFSLAIIVFTAVSFHTMYLNMKKKFEYKKN